MEQVEWVGRYLLSWEATCPLLAWCWVFQALEEGLPLSGGLTATVGLPRPVFCDDLKVALNLWLAPQPTGSCEAVGADM